MAATNILTGRARRPILRAGLHAASAAFAAQAEPDGKIGESFEIIYLAGWSPSPTQPQPAPRGSASHSLASALKPPKKV
jgi:hypothetical protein